MPLFPGKILKFGLITVNTGINNIYKEKEMIIQPEILLFITNSCTAESLDIARFVFLSLLRNET